MARRGTGGGGGDAPPPELPDDIAADPDVDPEPAARMICLRLLTVRARSRVELADGLRSRGVPDDAADRVLQRFTEVGLIDDAAFAATFASSRMTERGLSGREIARQLRLKGVDDEQVAAALAEIDSETERANARALVERKLRSMTQLEPAVKTRRLVGLLARKGYDPGLAFDVVREAVIEADSGIPSDEPHGSLDPVAWSS
jgi:regulatory protein